MSSIDLRSADRPRAINWIVAGTIAAAVLQAIVGVLLYRHRSDFALAEARLHPDFSVERARDRADGIVVGGLGTHIILGVVYLILAYGLWRGSNGARTRVTVLLIITTIGGAVAAAILGNDVPSIQNGIRGVQATSTVLRLLVLYLLWVPTSTREFFGARS